MPKMPKFSGFVIKIYMIAVLNLQIVMFFLTFLGAVFAFLKPIYAYLVAFLSTIILIIVQMFVLFGASLVIIW